ncbi:MAG TPA: TMEM175 family protein [Vitreimonas sp.]|uniref:TMEM175 family protein n=1 Tax=Vitreimonas sp. TaxID=3069702 RepID=UPI002D3A9A45|nr:TMEM175 family protein [Vitreimonas sp.]HYD89478.1 TMEM175 family protein [Vitreimonas sp.]
MAGVRTLHPLKGERDFLWRGGNPTRVEALTDMVFAFALTLLVVSNAPPSTFAELTDLLWGFPGFAAAFAILLLIWHSHYIFFRRFALQDGWTTTLNAALLFLILFFVYPLKYLATMLSAFVASLAAGAPEAPFSMEEARSALMMMSGGYALVFAMFAALYAHAVANADRLELSPRERQLTRFGLWQQLVHVTIGGAVVAAAAVLPLFWAPFAGFLYFFIGPLMFVGGVVLAPDPKPAPTPGM